MVNQRVNRRAELELLLRLYKLYEDNFECLRFNTDFIKLLENQEKKIADIFTSITNLREAE